MSRILLSFMFLLSLFGCNSRRVVECRDLYADSLARVNDSLESYFDTLSTFKHTMDTLASDVFLIPNVVNQSEYSQSTIYTDKDTSVTLPQLYLKDKYIRAVNKILFDKRYGRWIDKCRFGMISLDTAYSKNKFVVSFIADNLHEIMKACYGGGNTMNVPFGYCEMGKVKFIVIDKINRKLYKNPLFHHGRKMKFIFSQECMMKHEPTPYDPYQWYILYNDGKLCEKNWNELLKEHGYLWERVDTTE